MAALIHSELSEALEEARAGRPLVWHRCAVDDKACEESGCNAWDDGSGCDAGKAKPEGVAVELIDGVIRILDYIGKLGQSVEFGINGLIECVGACYGDYSDYDVARIVNTLHEWTAQPSSEGAVMILRVAGIALAWVKARGLDPEALILEKHRYNVGRERMHGKRF